MTIIQRKRSNSRPGVSKGFNLNHHVKISLIIITIKLVSFFGAIEGQAPKNRTTGSSFRPYAATLHLSNLHTRRKQTIGSGINNNSEINKLNASVDQPICCFVCLSIIMCNFNNQACTLLSSNNGDGLHKYLC